MVNIRQDYDYYKRPMPRRQVVIDGQGGPYDPRRFTGGYGRNTQLDVQKYLSQGGNICDALVRYSPCDPRYGFHGLDDLYSNAVGYAHEAVKAADRNGDSAIDVNELATEYGGDCEKARYALRILDRNHDGKIDVAERAASTLAMDADQDGQITAEERAAFDQRMQCNPNGLAQTLGGLLTNSRADLQGRAQQIASEDNCAPNPNPGCNNGYAGAPFGNIAQLFQMMIRWMFGMMGGGNQGFGGYGYPQGYGNGF